MPPIIRFGRQTKAARIIIPIGGAIYLPRTRATCCGLRLLVRTGLLLPHSHLVANFCKTNKSKSTKARAIFHFINFSISTVSVGRRLKQTSLPGRHHQVGRIRPAPKTKRTSATDYHYLLRRAVILSTKSRLARKIINHSALPTDT